MSAISALLPPEARRKRTPTEAELALTYPPGYRGDPDREDERRPGFHGRGNFPSVKAVDRDGVAIVHELLHDVGRAAPAPLGIAAQVDPVGAVGAHPPGLGEDRGPGHPRGMVDLGDDLDRVAAIVGQIGALVCRVQARDFLVIPIPHRHGDFVDVLRPSRFNLHRHRDRGG
jgi:hypothetical protein